MPQPRSVLVHVRTARLQPPAFRLHVLHPPPDPNFQPYLRLCVACRFVRPPLRSIIVGGYIMGGGYIISGGYIIGVVTSRRRKVRPSTAASELVSEWNRMHPSRDRLRSYESTEFVRRQPLGV